MSGHVSPNHVPAISNFEGIFSIFAFLFMSLSSFRLTKTSAERGLWGTAASTKQGCHENQLSPNMALPCEVLKISNDSNSAASLSHVFSNCTTCLQKNFFLMFVLHLLWLLNPCLASMAVLRRIWLCHLCNYFLNNYSLLSCPPGFPLCQL